MEFDTHLVLAALAVFLAGVLRGFSGFGAGMVLVPSLSLLYSPVVAVVSVALLEIVPAIQLLPPTLSRCHWRSIAPMSLAAVLCVPLGSLLLITVDEASMRTGISVVVLAGVAILASGLRFRGRPESIRPPFAVGIVSGLVTGATSLGGIPVILYYLSGVHNATTIRSSIITFLFVMVLVSITTYLAYGIITQEILLRCLLLAPVFVVSIAIGGRLFGKVPDKVFRTTALAMLTAIGLITLFS